MKRLAQGQKEFTTDASVGVHGVGPFGIGGKLDGDAPVGDGLHLRVALFAPGGGVGLLAARIRRRREIGGQQHRQVGNLGWRDAGQGVGAKLGDDGLHGFLHGQTKRRALRRAYALLNCLSGGNHFHAGRKTKLMKKLLAIIPSQAKGAHVRYAEPSNGG